MARAKAEPAAAEADYQWVTEDEADRVVRDEEELMAAEAVLEEVVVVVAEADTRLQSRSTGTHSSNSR